MKSIINYVSVALILSFMIPGGLGAQNKKKAQVGFRFLENPVSAEVVGRGATGVVSTTDANGIFWNPALIGWQDDRAELSLNYSKGIADINYSSAAVTYKIDGVGVLGLSLINMDYGDFYATRNSEGGEGYVDLGTFTPKAYCVGLAFSQKVTERFSYGVHAKYAYQDLGDAWISTGTSYSNMILSQKSYSKGVLVADIGAYYDFLYHGICFGATVQNVSKELKYESEAFPLPFAISFAAKVEPLGFFLPDEKDHRAVLSMELRQPRDYGQKMKFGLEYSFIDKFFARIGYMANLDERGFTCGAGIVQELYGKPFSFDYAYEPFGLFGGSHFISLKISY